MEGEAYYGRCVAILADLEDADRGASGAVVGLLRVDAIGHLVRTMLLPNLPALLALHPELTVHISEGERFIDLVREGVDCVVRAGALADSDMIVRRLDWMEEITVASPSYLAIYGMPRTPEDLGRHRSVGFVSSQTGQPLPLEFTRGARSLRSRCRPGSRSAARIRAPPRHDSGSVSSRRHASDPPTTSRAARWWKC